MLSLVDAVWMCLRRSGFEAMVVADPADGVRAHPGSQPAIGAASAVVGRDLEADAGARTVEGIRDDLLAVVRAPRQLAFVVELAPRFASNPEQLTREELALFVAAERAALTSRPVPARPGAARQVPLFNPVIWIVDRDRDLPAWLVAHEDHVRSIAVPRPDYGQRDRCARRLLSSLAGWDSSDEHRRDEMVARLVGQTDGMTLTSLFSITLLATDAGMGLDGIEDAARAYRVGVVDNPWRTGVMASPSARNRALRADAGVRVDAEAVASRARELGVMGWVRPTGKVHAEGAPDAVEALMAFLGDAVPTEGARVEGHEQFAIRGVSAGVFVVQEHQATAHHYDLRLEVGGVMRSWAVPKGPSLDPAAKRLAVEVEDHGLEHNDFEGTLGDGGVIVWDRGTYEQGGRVAWPEALERGHAVFVLHGEKLRGGFALQRTRPGVKPQWLLIKRGDDEARPGCSRRWRSPARRRPSPHRSG